MPSTEVKSSHPSIHTFRTRVSGRKCPCLRASDQDAVLPYGHFSRTHITRRRQRRRDTCCVSPSVFFPPSKRGEILGGVKLIPLSNTLKDSSESEIFQSGLGIGSYSGGLSLHHLQNLATDGMNSSVHKQRMRYMIFDSLPKLGFPLNICFCAFAFACTQLSTLHSHTHGTYRTNQAATRPSTQAEWVSKERMGRPVRIHQEKNSPQRLRRKRKGKGHTTHGKRRRNVTTFIARMLIFTCRQPRRIEHM